MGKLLCFFGFHRIKKDGRFMFKCDRKDCIAYENTDGLRMYWRWDLSLWQKFR